MGQGTAQMWLPPPATGKWIQSTLATENLAGRETEKSIWGRFSRYRSDRREIGEKWEAGRPVCS